MSFNDMREEAEIALDRFEVAITSEQLTKIDGKLAELEDFVGFFIDSFVDGKYVGEDFDDEVRQLKQLVHDADSALAEVVPDDDMQVIRRMVHLGAAGVASREEFDAAYQVATTVDHGLTKSQYRLAVDGLMGMIDTIDMFVLDWKEGKFRDQEEIDGSLTYLRVYVEDTRRALVEVTRGVEFEPVEVYLDELSQEVRDAR